MDKYYKGINGSKKLALYAHQKDLKSMIPEGENCQLLDFILKN